MPEQPPQFGPELRRMRVHAGLSLEDLARTAHYSKGYLSRIENGHKPPTPDLARRCDSVLRAEGALAELVSPPSSASVLPGSTDDQEVWQMNMGADGKSWFRPMSRRDALGMGAGSALSFGLSTKGLSATARDASSLEVFRTLFDQLRLLGQTASPGVVMPTLIAQTHTLKTLSARAAGGTRLDLLALTSRYAEYTGWMAQEAGDDAAALWWTDRAVELATAGEDNNLASYALVRRALITLYDEDATQTIELARQAQAGKVPARIRGLAAQREAQGHALAGDYDSCFRALDRARNLLAGAEPAAPGPILGPMNLSDPAAMVAGWCMHDLGRPREAAEMFDHELSLIPRHALRTRARFGVRQALAYAEANEIEHACGLTDQLLSLVDVVSSATILSDLKRLTRTLARFQSHRSARELYPRLTASLNSLSP